MEWAAKRAAGEITVVLGGERHLRLGFSAECMACVMDRQLRALPQAWSDAKRSEYLRRVMRIIVESDPCDYGPMVTRRIDRLAAEWAVPKRDFKPIKCHWNEKMLSLAPDLRADILAAPDPLARAMQYARTANYIDFGAQLNVNEAELLSLLREAPGEALDPVEYARMLDELGTARRLAYVTDNCGEVVADRLLIEQLLARFPSLQITAVVRGADVGNDATLEDAEAAGLPGFCEVMGNGTPLLGTFLDEMGQEARERLAGADVVISKGQANFETLSGCGLNVYYLFLCKCGRFERHFRLPRLRGVLANERRINYEEEAQ